MNGICLRHNAGRLRGSLFVYCGLRRMTATAGAAGHYTEHWVDAHPRRNDLHFIRRSEPKKWVGAWSTDRGGGPGAAAARSAAARREDRAGAWSSRAAGRARPARAWRGRGRRYWVAPSLTLPPSAHSARPWDTAVQARLFSEDFFRRGRGRGGAATNGSACPPRPALPPTLLFTCRILKGFSACRYGFSSTSRFTYARPSAALAASLLWPSSETEECGRRVCNAALHKNCSNVHSYPDSVSSVTAGRSDVQNIPLI